ncbi:MAG: hypothetical protein U0936_18620 [Planctomycetaceae bacterium]
MRFSDEPRYGLKLPEVRKTPVQILGVLGAFSCAVSVVLSFIPQSSAESFVWYASKMLLGVAGFMFLGLLVYRSTRAM